MNKAELKDPIAPANMDEEQVPKTTSPKTTGTVGDGSLSLVGVKALRKVSLFDVAWYNDMGAQKPLEFPAARKRRLSLKGLQEAVKEMHMYDTQGVPVKSLIRAGYYVVLGVLEPVKPAGNSGGDVHYRGRVRQPEGQRPERVRKIRVAPGY